MQTRIEKLTVIEPETGAAVGFAENCTIVHEGREFTAGGAHVDPDYAVGYPKLAQENIGSTGDVCDWEGNRIGSARVTGRWPVRSYIGSQMLQIECTIAGRTYTGRGFGDGMIWKGRARKS